VPLVGMSEDMVAEGLVTLLARPGGNITGFANYEYPIGGKWLELLKDTAPGRSRVGFSIREFPLLPRSHTSRESRRRRRHSACS